MTTSSRFTVGIHILTLLAYSRGDVLTSEYIAGSVNTNAVVIRRLLKLLRAAKLVQSHGGPGGGWQLALAPSRITLRDVYRATEDGSLFGMPSNPPNSRCPVGNAIQDTLTRHLDGARAALEESLGHVSIADLLDEVKSAEIG